MARRRGNGIRVAAFGALVGLLGACAVGPKIGSTVADGTPGGPEAAASTTVSTLTAGDLEAIVTKTTTTLRVPGAVALVITPHGTVTALVGTTQADGGGDPVSLDQHVRVGSNTKTWTATVILQLVDEGKIGLDDPVSTYRPDVPGGDHITIAQLLTMRSGLLNYTETYALNAALDQTPDRVWQPEELIKLGLDLPPYFAPGTDFHYSNTNTALLGRIAEEVTGTPLADLFQQRLFTPTGMTQSSLPALTDSTLPTPFAHGYSYETAVLTMSDLKLPPDLLAQAQAGTLKPHDTTNVNPSWAGAAGAGVSTATDLATWVQALVGGQLLSPTLQQTRLDSMESTNPGNPTSAAYGLGLAKFGPLYGHTGELPGYNSFMGYDPEQHVTVVTWTNLAPAAEGTDPATTIARDVIGALYGTR